MKNRRNDKKPTDDPEDVTSWTLPSQVAAEDLQESPDFFIPPTSTSLGVPPDLDAVLPTLPPPPPGVPDVPALETEGDLPATDSWAEAAPSAEVRDFPTSATTTTPFRPDLPMPAAVIDLTSRTEHPYDDIYSLSSETSTDMIDVTEPQDNSDNETINLADRLDLADAGTAADNNGVRELPSDLRSALKIATTPALGLPKLSDLELSNLELSDLDNDDSIFSSLAPPPTAQATDLTQIPSILTVDVLGADATSFSGLFTDVFTDNGFDVISVSETSILLSREAGTVTIDLAEDSAGCILEIVGLPVTAIKKLMLAGLLQIGFEIQASRTHETVLRNQQKSLVRVVSV